MPPPRQRSLHPYAETQQTLSSLADAPPMPLGSPGSTGRSSALPFNFNFLSEIKPLREQDRLLPLANIAQIMAEHSRSGAKVSKGAKLFMQEVVSEFIAFVTSEANDVCIRKKKKAIASEEVYEALENLDLGFMLPILKAIEESTKRAKAVRSSAPRLSDAPLASAPRFCPDPFAPPLAIPRLASSSLSLGEAASLLPDLLSPSTPQLLHASSPVVVDVDDEPLPKRQFKAIGKLPETPDIPRVEQAPGRNPRETMPPKLVGSHWLPAFSFF
ncbi:hypothetical protein AB1Y20_008327 [Prymnesium parvum]|uniref:Transcription factor CBF/NF-Y/archaeal histone domain-containing protein n=1 Tax=Prymnesium parvum TaxID=97485 RepID=A0AB34ITV8_PRYPA